MILIFVLAACSAKENNEPKQPLICTSIIGKNKITDWGIILKHLDSSDIPVVHKIDFSNASSQYLDVIECGYSSDKTSLIVTFSLGESLIGKTEQDASRFIQDLSALGYTNYSLSYVKVEENYKGKVLDVVDIQTSHVITIILVGE